MSAISLKSITGITSITTPAGVDNQLTLHTNNTTERLKIDVAGNVHVNNQLAVAGVTTFASNVNLGDNDKLIIGDHGDIQIYNDGTKSVIKNGGSSLGGNNNSLHFYSQNDILTNTTYSQYFHCGATNESSVSPRQLALIRNEGVKAYYNNDLKLETSPNGVDITGGLTVSGISTFTGTTNFDNGAVNIINGGGAYNTHLNYNDIGTNYITSANGTGTYFRGSSNGVTAMAVQGAGPVDIDGDLRHLGDTDTMLQFGTNTISLKTAGSERLRIDSAGRLLIGTATTKSAGSGQYAKLNVEGYAGGSECFASFSRAEAASAMSANDEVANLTFNDSAGYEFARIQVLADAATGATDTPGRIVFKTTADGASSSTERLRITSDGQIGVNQASPKAWHSSYRSIQIHNGASLYGSADVSFVGLGANHYLNTSGNFIYSNTDFASRFYQVNGEFYFESAPSSNAGGTFSFQQKLRITQTGQIRIDQATSANNGIRMRPSGWNYDFRFGAVSSSGGSIWLGQNYDPTAGTRDSSSYGTNYLRFTTQGEIMLGTGATNSNPTERLKITNAGNVGINEDNPQTTLNVRGCISTGRNVAREVGQIIDISSSYSGGRNGVSVINGIKNYEENPNADWITANGQRVNANLTIDLQAQYTCDRFVIYNQNEYTNNVREVKHFTLEGSNDKSSWTTLLDDECGASYAHEPNPGFSFRIPSDFTDDDEGATFRYWRFTMKDFHGSTTLGGVMELELYEVDSSNKTISEVSTHHLSAMDITAQNIYHDLPAFYVARSTTQGISNQTWTKIQFTDDNSGAFDTSGAWSNSNYRFTPTIPGYYQFQMNQSISHGSVQASYIAIYKNGSSYNQSGRYFFSGDNYDDAVLNTSCLMHCDGQSDYVEFYAWMKDGTTTMGGSSNLSQASGFLVRHAGYRRHGDGV